MEHTRLHTIFRCFLSNIHVGCCLFSHNPPQKTKKIISVVSNAINSQRHIIINNIHQFCAKKKKCGAHMHVHQLSLSLLNIHVGCCLFSHNHNVQNHKNKKQWFGGIVNHYINHCFVHQ